MGNVYWKKISRPFSVFDVEALSQAKLGRVVVSDITVPPNVQMAFLGQILSCDVVADLHTNQTTKL